MKDKLVIILIIFFVLAGGAGGFWIFKKIKGGSDDVTPTPTPEGVLIETALEDRPYVSLTPRSDGRELTLAIFNIKNAKIIEYELVYLSQGLSRGVIGSVKLNSGETKISRKLLLGTCSKDVCKYDEGVTEGTLTLRFRAEDGVRKFIADFHLQKGDKVLTSLDEKFSLEGKVSTGVYFLTMNTIGLPKEIDGELVSDIYGVFTSGGKSVGSGMVKIDLRDGEIFSWDGSSWQEVKDGAVSSLATFVVVATP